jgi:hypothetical protein
MLKLVKNSMARPYHQKVYGVAQSGTNYARWVTTQNSTFKISHMRRVITTV